MSSQRYQLLPPLSGEEYAALRADVAEHGIRVPVDVDELGQVLDGHHRVRVAAELGIGCPTRVVAGLSDEQKRHHAVAVNAQRRMLTRRQRRDLVAAELAHDASRSDRAIGRICGVDHKTVGAIRRGGWGIPQPDRAQTDQQDTGLSPDEMALVTGKVIADVQAYDIAIVYALSNGISPATVVGWLVMALHKVTTLKGDENSIKVIREVLIEPRISYVLDHGQEVADELAGPDICRQPLTQQETADLAAVISWGTGA